MSRIDAARGLVGFVLRRTVADPVRAGRLTDTGWPPGLRAVVGAGLVTYAGLLLAAVISPAMRAGNRLVFTPPDQTLPALALPLICLAMIVALACLFTAALHLVWWLRLTIALVVVAIVLAPVDWAATAPIDWATLVLAGSLLGLVVARWNRRFHWLEFVVSLSLIGQAVVGHQLVRLAGLRQVDPSIAFSELSRLTLPLWALAVPAAILAGAALVEITTAAVTWTAKGLWGGALGRRPESDRWLAVAVLVVVVGRAAQVAEQITDVTDPLRLDELATGAVVAAVVLGSCALVTWLADRVPAGDPARRPDPDDLLPVWTRWTPFLALILAAAVSLQLLLGVVLQGLGLASAGRGIRDLGGAYATLAWAILGCVVAVTGGLVLARRGWRLSALLLIAFGTMYGLASVAELWRLTVSTDAVLVAGSLAAVGLLIWLAARRRLGFEAQVAVTGVLLLTIAYEYRDWIDEPLTQALGLAGVSAALLVGLLWRILTDNGYTRGDSIRFPQPSRVLLALANAIVGAASAAQVALLGGKFDLDLSQIERIGDTYLGFPLVLAVVFAGLSLAARGRDVQRAGAAASTVV